MDQKRGAEQFRYDQWGWATPYAYDGVHERVYEFDHDGRRFRLICRAAAEVENDRWCVSLCGGAEDVLRGAHMRSLGGETRYAPVYSSASGHHT